MWGIGVFVCSFLLKSVSTLEVLHEETVSISDAEAVVTGVARLPCDLTPPLPGDKVSLVIWYKDGAASPIYSLDVRSRSLDQATHWADERALGGRAFFKVSTDPAEVTHLAVESIREVDGGSYRCRVDFSRSPTRNSVVKLSIIVPPLNITIEDESGVPMHRSEIGPFTEGTTTQITCTSSGGLPAPRVSWWQDGVLVDESDEEVDGEHVRNTLQVSMLERRHLNMVFTCQASNNYVLPPLTANVSIDLYLRPLEVHLLGENQPLSAGSEYEVACQATGARPPAVITWWKAGVILDHFRETTSPDENVTTSVLTLSPLVEDSGKVLSCRAGNPHISDSSLDVAWALNVHYAPVLSLELGSNLNSSSIKEGVDVYFECNIRANPWVKRVTWKHNGRILYNNASAGTIISNQTLVLQSVSRNISGSYTCVASNPEGERESNPFQLDVKYGPVCVKGQQRVYGAARNEQVHMTCDVDANPPANLFRWSFNNSAVQSLEVGDVTSGGGRSIANYTPTSERDYGTLLCWGRNELGAQAVPCIFHLVPAGKPDAPRNCVLTNRTTRSLQVSCVRGFDGGLPQEFTLELYSASVGADEKRRLISNVTSRSKPEFIVTGLEPGVGYFLTVYSSNGKGRSGDVLTLSAATHKISYQEHRRTPAATETPLIPQVTSVLWIVAGVVIALAVVGIAGIIIFRFRGSGCDSDDSDGQRTGSASPETLVDPASKIFPGGGNTLTVDLRETKTLATITSDDALEMDERNPDVIPHKNDLDHPTEYVYDVAHKPGGQSGHVPFSMETPSHNAVYEHVQTLPRTHATTGQPVRWHHVMWRDTGTETDHQQQPQQPLLQQQPIFQAQQHAPYAMQASPTVLNVTPSILNQQQIIQISHQQLHHQQQSHHQQPLLPQNVHQLHHQDVLKQSSPHSSTSMLAQPLGYRTLPTAQKQNAETQTPTPMVLHKESAV